MKRLIFLKPQDYNPDNKKLKPTEENKLIAQMSSDCIKQFKKNIKADFSYIKVIKEYPGERPQIIIEFPDNKIEDIYNELIKIEGIEIIDNILPLEDQEDRPKEKPLKEKKELDLSKYMK